MQSKKYKAEERALLMLQTRHNAMKTQQWAMAWTQMTQETI